MNVENLIKHLNIPTPWDKVETKWSTKAEIELYVKRDDLIHPLISGNKWRKLSGILKPEEDIEAIVTFGGAYSNHLVACAASAYLLNIRSEGFIRGERPKIPSTVMEICEYFGMQLTYISRAEYRDIKQKSGIHNKTLFISEGGAGLHGTIGCADIITEADVRLDYLMVACGTGTTLAGLSKILNDESKLIGIPVLKGGEFIAAEAINMGAKENFSLETAYHFGGYAKTDQKLMHFIVEFGSETGILLDPVYTAKCFYAAKDLTLKGRFNPKSKVGLIHTGGLTGWYGKWTELISIKKPG